MSYLAGKLVLEIREGAPNNGQPDANQVGQVKQMRIDRGTSYPYVAAQAYRRWLRDTLTAGRAASPVVRTGTGTKQQAYTAGAPHRYLDDDLFGYMRALKNEETQRDTVVAIGTLRSVSARRPAEDFGTMSRGFSSDERPVIHRHQFYTADLAADLLIDMAHIGVFTLGGAGHRRNLTQAQLDEARTRGATMISFRGIDAITLDLDERRERLAALLEAMAAVRGGAKQALHYGDRTPALIALAPIQGGVNPFGRIIGDRDGSTVFRDDVLRSELAAWSDELTGPMRLGWAPGYLDEERERASAALKDLLEQGTLTIQHPRTMLQTCASELRSGAHEDWFTDAVWAT